MTGKAPIEMKIVPIVTVLLMFCGLWLKTSLNYFALAYARVLSIAGAGADPLPGYTAYMSSLWWNGLAIYGLAALLIVLIWRSKMVKLWMCIALLSIWIVGLVLYLPIY